MSGAHALGSRSQRRAPNIHADDVGRAFASLKLEPSPRPDCSTRTRLAHPCGAPEITTLTTRWSCIAHLSVARTYRVGLARRARAWGTLLPSTRSTAASGDPFFRALRDALFVADYTLLAVRRTSVCGGAQRPTAAAEAAAAAAARRLRRQRPWARAPAAGRRPRRPSGGPRVS